MQTYDQLFDQRGSAYDQAMRRFPQARAQEFAQALAPLSLPAGSVLGDVPAGGGYLRAWLPAGCAWLGHEPCASFTHHGTDTAPAGEPLLPLPWADASLDAAVSLAGVHHIADKRPLFNELHRVVKPGGQLVVSDVATGSAVARFLDGFVGDHNSTGHEGVFLDARTLEELRAAGWQVQSCAANDFHWVFEDRGAMASFCQGLFDIRRAGLDAIDQAIESALGTDRLADGRVGMRWSLLTIVAARAVA